MSNNKVIQKFKTGDKVRHGSGPVMIVREYEPKDGKDLTCEWFDKGELKEKSFHQDTLELYLKPPIDPFFTRKHNF